jgi:hypothetical protein
MEWKLFWKLYWQKQLRDTASLKARFMFLLWATVTYGMFDGKWNVLSDGSIHWVSKISAELGMGFLGLGFVGFATGRIIIDKIKGNGSHKEDDAYHSGDKLDG